MEVGFSISFVVDIYFIRAGDESINKIVVLGCDSSYPLGEIDWKGGEGNPVDFC